MSEREDVFILADRLLDAPNADPDDDLRVLARQLIRHRDREQRILAFLRERAAWLKYEREHGGDWKHLATREEECRWIEQAIRHGRQIEDGRPSWLVNSIAVEAGE